MDQQCAVYTSNQPKGAENEGDTELSSMHIQREKRQTQRHKQQDPHQNIM